MNEVVDYIISFLTENVVSKNDLKFIGYTSDLEEFSKYKIVIRKSNFFDKNVYLTEKSMPALPLAEWEGTPLLFGEPTVEKIGETIVLNADIIASSFFLISRYEELINKTRDEHGRLVGKKSLPFRAGFISRPIVDEYSDAFCNLLKINGFNIKGKKIGFNKVYFTHDVDKLAHYRNFRNFAGAILRLKNVKTAVSTFFGKIENDPFYAFPFLFEQNKRLKHKDLEQIVFILTGNKIEKRDDSRYNIFGKDFKKFIDFCDENQVKIGLHTSYSACQNQKLIEKEKSALEKATSRIISSNRNHYLCSKEPQDFEKLINAGITDDFTMSYADVAGFRLGTSRAVRWINPENLQLTPLVLHPLTAMECTLSDERYMNLSEIQAFEYLKILSDNTVKNNGDLCFLWHNTSVAQNANSFHRNLYKKIIDYLCELQVEK